MKPRKNQKILQIYDLATNIGSILVKQVDDPIMVDFGNKLVKEGKRAIQSSGIFINKKMIENIKFKLHELYTDGDSFDILEASAMLVLGLGEIAIYGGIVKIYSNELLTIIESVIKELDPELLMDGIYGKALSRYNSWMNPRRKK